MKKIPTLFVRDANDMSRVTRVVHPTCQWVISGEGVATRKYDGTCVMLDEDGTWWARREVKVGKVPPLGYVETGFDDVTGKYVGWEPIEQSPFIKAFQQVEYDRLEPGTYELCGPKINGNPEMFTVHTLISHNSAQKIDDAPCDYDGLREWLLIHNFEGIVWHHPDGRMAKIKRRDFKH